MILFIIMATIIFAGLCFVWKSDTGLNFTIKMTLFVMMVFGVYEIAKIGVTQ